MSRKHIPPVRHRTRPTAQTPSHHRPASVRPSAASAAEGAPSRPKDGKGDYEVGYSRPPKHGQFRRGTSGNPKGRPKGVRNFGTLFNEMLHESTPIILNGVPRRIPTQMAAALKLKERALKGDLRALISLIKLAIEFSKEAADPRQVPEGGAAPFDGRTEQDFADFAAEVREQVARELTTQTDLVTSDEPDGAPQPKRNRS